MPVYENNGKWYARGSVHKKRYHKLLDGIKSKKEALEIDAEIRRKLTLIKRGLIQKEPER